MKKREFIKYSSSLLLVPLVGCPKPTTTQPPPPPPPKVDPIDPNPPKVSIIPPSYSGRAVEVQGSVTVSNSNVVFNVWDSGQIDGDIISLVVNGSIVLSNFTLDGPDFKRSIAVSLPTDSSSYILLFAHNTGSVGPNTAALSIDDGFAEKTLVLSANLQTNGAYDIFLN